MKNAGSLWELNPGSLTSVTSILTTELRQPDNHQQWSGTECFRTPLGINQILVTNNIIRNDIEDQMPTFKTCYEYHYRQSLLCHMTSYYQPYVICNHGNSYEYNYILIWLSCGLTSAKEGSNSLINILSAFSQ